MDDIAEALLRDSKCRQALVAEYLVRNIVTDKRANIAIEVLRMNPHILRNVLAKTNNLTFLEKVGCMFRLHTAKHTCTFLGSDRYQPLFVLPAKPEALIGAIAHMGTAAKMGATLKVGASTNVGVATKICTAIKVGAATKVGTVVKTGLAYALL